MHKCDQEVDVVDWGDNNGSFHCSNQEGWPEHNENGGGVRILLLIREL